MNKYLYFEDNLEIKKYPSSLIVMFIKGAKEHDIYNIKEMRKSFVLSNTAAEIIKQIDGTKTIEEIINYFVDYYKEDYNSISQKVTNFLNDFQNIHKLVIKTSLQKNHRPVIIVEDAVHYPSIASLELTDKCNLQCIHCYGDFNIKNNNTLSFDEVVHILSSLRKVGVEVIELTGGECTMHPYFKEILLKALELGYTQIAILTNGIALNSEIIEIIANNKIKFLIQVDLQSLNDDYLFWFTKKRNTLEQIKNNIESLAKYDIKARIATTVTHKNIHELFDIAEWLYNVGIKLYALTIVTNVGRAKEDDRDLYLNEEDVKTFNSLVNKIKEKFDKLLNESPTSQLMSNCGCITNHVTINSKGDIKICTMDNLKYVDSSIGNVLSNEVKDIYDSNKDFLEDFYGLIPPSVNEESCKNCSQNVFCNGCLLRTFISIGRLKEKCKWYKESLPETIKIRFNIT